MSFVEIIKQINYLDLKFIYDPNSLLLVNAMFKPLSNQTEGTVIKAGTVLGKVTADNTVNVYDNSANDGRQVAFGVLMYDVKIKPGTVQEIPVAIRGVFVKEHLIGYDADAKTDLNAREIKIDNNKTLVVI
ncbi:MAG: head decoration protein [Candidatus Omnitrophica bacterium]|nr:head decoration protein [Candidatus Omnitrophota bacterium]